MFCYIVIVIIIVDINECEENTRCGDEAECKNTIGSYQCACLAKGFAYSEKTERCFGKSCLAD